MAKDGAIPEILQETAKYLQIKLTDTPGRTAQEWVDHFKAKGVTLNEAAEKILRENLIPTKNLPVCAVIITTQTMGTESYSNGSALEFATTHNFCDLTVEDACQLRDTLSKEEMASLGLECIFVFFPEIKTHEKEYLIHGKPQCLMIGSHPLHGDYFYCLPYGSDDQINEGGGVAFWALCV